MLIYGVKVENVVSSNDGRLLTDLESPVDGPVGPEPDVGPPLKLPCGGGDPAQLLLKHRLPLDVKHTETQV